jgi:outer membrane protein
MTIMHILRNILLLLFLAQFASGQNAFSLDEAVRYAQQHNVKVQNSRLDRQAAATKVERLQNSWLPRLSASAEFRYNPILQTTLLPASLTGGNQGELQEVQFGTDFSSALGLRLQQKVFDPVFRPQQNLRKIEGRQAALDEKYQEQLTRLQVEAAYDQVLLHYHIYQNSRSLLKHLDKLRQDVQIQVKNELESPKLLNDLNEQYRQQQHKILADSLNWMASKTDLKLEMNFPSSQPLHLTDSLKLTMADTVALNPADNFEIQKINLQLEETQLLQEQLRRSRLPSVNAEAFLGTQFFSNSPDLYHFNRWFGQSYIGLTASVPIYDGGDKQLSIQLENLKMEQLKNELQAYRNQQPNKTIRANLLLEQARAQATLAGRSVRTAEQNLQLARTNYQNELTGFRPVFEALQALVNAREQAVNARINYVEAWLEARMLDL